MSNALSQLRHQVIWTRLIAIVEEQAQTLMRTAFSTTVRDAGDLSAALFDLEGRLIAEAVTGTPGHVNSMAAGVRHFIDRFPLATMEPGDHFITNDPWLTAGHLHDVTVISPRVPPGADRRPVRGVLPPGGYRRAGPGPDGRSIYEEGIQIPLMKLASRGELNQTSNCWKSSARTCARPCRCAAIS
jgi:N-methylhydantoinase B